MLPADGARDPPLVRARRGGRSATRDPLGRNGHRCPDRLGRRLGRHRRARRGDRRDPPCGLLRVPPLSRDALMRANGIFATPRPVPGRLVPALGGFLIVLLALPIFLLAGWDIAGWALGAVLWVAVEGIDLVLTRLRGRTDNVAGSA